MAQKHSTIRIPPDLRDWIAAQAIVRHRSFNQEIVDRLERTRWQDEPESRPPSVQALESKTAA